MYKSNIFFVSTLIICAQISFTISLKFKKTNLSSKLKAKYSEAEIEDFLKSEEYHAGVKQVFDHMDSDHNGTLSLKEMTPAITIMFNEIEKKPPTADQISHIYKKIAGNEKEVDFKTFLNVTSHLIRKYAPKTK